MTAARSRMAEKIAALRAKTLAAGCTEAEALAAAELAARLMRDHGISDAELGMSSAKARETTVSPTWRVQLVNTIAWCTNTHVFLDAEEGCFVFTGREPGPDIAVYLREVTFRAVAAEERRFKEGAFYRGRRSLATKRQAAADFRTGLVFRLCWRLRKLFERVADDRAREEAAAVVRHQRTELTTITPSRPRPARFSTALSAGWKAGGDVALNRGIGGDRGPAALIGKPS